MKELAFQKPLSLAIAEGATTPDPGQAGVAVWSSTLGKPVFWDGAKWTAGDPWTYIVLASDFSTSGTSVVDVTGMAFTPASNKRYIVEGNLFGRAAATTTGVQLGVAWPTGLTDSMAEIRALTSSTGRVIAAGNDAAAFTVVATGVGSTTGSWPLTFLASIIAGASPAGTFKLQLASEVNASAVTLRAGSWMRYRSY